MDLPAGLKLGLHCPVRDGYGAALERAVALGCPVYQMLPYRRHDDPRPEELARARSERERTGLELVVHSRFVPSLASSDPARRGRSVELLAYELRLAAALGARAFVLHAGAFSEQAEPAEGERLFARSLDEALAREEGVPILLENVPGGGRRLGGRLEELARLLEPLRRRQPASGICVDTAHAWAAGYELSTAEGMLKFLSRLHRLFGADSVKAFHLNDTRALLGSQREHHAHWGEGHLRGEGLRVLLEREEYAGAFGILETPPGPEDARNLAFVRR